MNKKKEIQYLEKHWKKMQNGLKTFMQTDDKEQLHILRVEVKKLRAMLTLIETVTHNKKLFKFFKPVRRVFKHAGDIRNSQINVELAHKYQLHNKSFEIAQHETMTQSAEEFKLRAPKYLKKLKQARNHIKGSLGKIKDKSIAGFYRKQLKQIAGSLAIPHFDDALHECRKQLKVLMYNHQLMGKALENRLTFNGQYIDDLQTYIGNWHDHVLAIDLFASPEVKDKPVVAKIKKQNHKAEQGIAEMSRDFLTKATTQAPVKEEELVKA